MSHQELSSLLDSIKREREVVSSNVLSLQMEKEQLYVSVEKKFLEAIALTMHKWKSEGNKLYSLDFRFLCTPMFEFLCTQWSSLNEQTYRTLYEIAECSTEDRLPREITYRFWPFIPLVHSVFNYVNASSYSDFKAILKQSALTEGSAKSPLDQAGSIKCSFFINTTRRFHIDRGILRLYDLNEFQVDCAAVLKHFRTAENDMCYVDQLQEYAQDYYTIPLGESLVLLPTGDILRKQGEEELMLASSVNKEVYDLKIAATLIPMLPKVVPTFLDRLLLAQVDKERVTLKKLQEEKQQLEKEITSLKEQVV